MKNELSFKQGRVTGEHSMPPRKRQDNDNFLNDSHPSKPRKSQYDLSQNMKDEIKFGLHFA